MKDKNDLKNINLISLLMNTNLIKANVTKLQEFIKKDEMILLKQKNQELFKYKIESEFLEFNTKYPTIVKKIMNGDDISYLNKMLEAMDNINNKKTTKEKAEKKLGEELAEEYIYPLVKDNKK
jgi:hypothetical protein